MGVIPQGVTHLVESVVSYLYIILLILVIVKIIQLVGSFGGFGGSGSSRGSSDAGNNNKTGNKDKSSNTDSKDDGPTNIKKKRPHYTYLDPTRLGKVKFKVEDVEGNPVKGSEIIITPNRQKRRFSEPASPAAGGTVEAPPNDEDK